MKTAGRRTPNCRASAPDNRAHGAADQNRSCSNRWAEKQEKIQPLELCFFLTSPFREQIRTWRALRCNLRVTNGIDFSQTISLMKECPNCGLVSPDNAERCDCGYNFLAGPGLHSPTKRALRVVIKAIGGTAAVACLLTPVAPWNGFVVFATSSLVMLGCFLAWGLLED